MLEKKPTKINGQDGFLIDYGVVDGKRKRHYFLDGKDADRELDQYQRDVKKAGQWWARQPEADRLMIQSTLQKMEDAGTNLQTVWVEHQKWKADRELPGSSAITLMAYEDVVTEWGRRKRDAGKDARYVLHATADLMKFGAGQEKRPIHEIPHEQLEKWMREQKIQKKGADFGKPWGLSTKRTWMSLFHGLWDLAVLKCWATKNIVDQLEPIGEISRIKKIYENDIVRNILAGAMHDDVTKSCLIIPVLGFFGCMRPEEITSDKARRNELPEERWFTWDCIDLKTKQIDVSADIAKTGDERIIDLQPTAVAWLKLCKELKCPLPPVNNFRIMDRIFELIGLEPEDRIRDGFRKNCATHLRPIVRNDYDVVSNMGNSVRTLLKAYAKLKIPEPQSRAYWKLDPEAIKAYMKTREWERVLREGAKKAIARAEAEAEAVGGKATAASEAKLEP